MSLPDEDTAEGIVPSNEDPKDKVKINDEFLKVFDV